MGEAASRGPVASVVLASAYSLWSTLHTVTMAASGRLGQALVMRQSTVAFERISCPVCSRSSLLESGTLFLRVLASGSSCSGCLGVAYEFENWILRETTFFVGAMLGTTVDTCSASVLWWPWKTVHIFYVVADSFPEASLLHSV